MAHVRGTKVQSMIFTHKSVNREEVVIEIAGERVQQATSANFLGIRIDDRLCFNEHTIALCKKLSCALGIMHRMSVYVPMFVLRMLYFAVFYPHLNYVISVWEVVVSLISTK